MEFNLLFEGFYEASKCGGLFKRGECSRSFNESESLFLEELESADSQRSFRRRTIVAGEDESWRGLMKCLRESSQGSV
jgi:hypothetical protein